LGSRAISKWAGLAQLAAWPERGIEPPPALLLCCAVSMKRFLAGAIATALFAFTASAAGPSPDTEIEALLAYVGELNNVSFIRNGDPHTAKEAEAHLRLKWTNQKSRIATAEDFIRFCGTKSSLSGKPYIIRFPDGHEEPAAQVLSSRLQMIRAKATR
jgi:hypothetical protein